MIWPVVSSKSGSLMSTMRRSLEYGGVTLGTELDAVEGGGAHGAFYRAWEERSSREGGGRCRFSGLQWSDICVH
jgi:hypothetical protein